MELTEVEKKKIYDFILALNRFIWDVIKDFKKGNANARQELGDRFA